jgi:hypothetical protein
VKANHSVRVRPILFSGPMVRALLDGRKTQTRRAVKPQPPERWEGARPHKIALTTDDEGAELFAYSQSAGNGDWTARCPYGVPGDRLWVRETWAHDGPDLETVRTRHEDMLPGGDSYGPYYRATEIAPDTLLWRPSIFMPRWASRITLEITDVRVERLQDISEADALAEGVTHSLSHPAGRTAAENYSWLWDDINGEGAWASNPWVWVLTFKRIEAA